MRSIETKKLLVVVAHPDDEVLGCGGTIRRMANKGADIIVLILGEGLKSRGQVENGAIKKLRTESMKAAEILGAKIIIFESFPDNEFDSVPILRIIQKIKKIIKKYKPDMVLTHSNTDLNIDHKITHEAVKVACRPMPNNGIKQLLCFEVPSSTEWGFESSNNFTPNFFVNIEDTLKTKMHAMSAYKGEIRKFPHPRSLKYMEALAKIRGGQSGFEAAEGFQLILSKT